MCNTKMIIMFLYFILDRMNSDIKIGISGQEDKLSRPHSCIRSKGCGLENSEILYIREDLLFAKDVEKKIRSKIETIFDIPSINEWHHFPGIKKKDIDLIIELIINETDYPV